jgi:hypothetical protein
MLRHVWLECMGEIGGKRGKPRQSMLNVDLGAVLPLDGGEWEYYVFNRALLGAFSLG